jgi:hypothetical protein
MENDDYCENNLKEVLEPLYLDMLINRPKDIINFSLEWLMKRGGYTINGKSFINKYFF